MRAWKNVNFLKVYRIGWIVCGLWVASILVNGINIIGIRIVIIVTALLNGTAAGHRIERINPNLA